MNIALGITLLVTINILMVSTAQSEGGVLNVSEWQSAKQILVIAKQRVEGNGWQQGSTTEVERECMSTALEHAWKDTGKSLVDFQYALKAMSEAINVSERPVTYSGDPLSVPYWGRNLMYWNDAPGRTEKEIISAFKAAITIADSRAELAMKENIKEESLNTFDKRSLKMMLEDQ